MFADEDDVFYIWGCRKVTGLQRLRCVMASLFGSDQTPFPPGILDSVFA